MNIHDTFISYATEDNDFASEVAYGIQANGMSVWFAPLTLKVGNKLLDSIESGLQNSRTGILILSKNYLAKKWTAHEMDILIRQHIENDKQILPVWLGVNKNDVEKRHITLSGIVALTETKDIPHVVSKLVEALSDGAPSRGVIPSWENPAYRFLQGLGEVNLQTSEGLTTTIFELLIHGKPDDFPFWLAGKTYTKVQLLEKVAMIIGPDPDRVKRFVGIDGYDKLYGMCVENGKNPNYYY